MNRKFTTQRRDEIYIYIYIYTHTHIIFKPKLRKEENNWPRRRVEDDKIGFKQSGYECVERLDLAHDMLKWRGLAVIVY